MSKRVIIIDTNIILYDPKAVYKFGNNTIILLPTVLEEADNHKKKSDEVGRASREFNREIDALRASSAGGLHEGFELPSGGTIRTWAKPISERNLQRVANVVDVKKNDNRILAACLDVQDEYPNDEAVLVTKDFNLRILADCFQIVAEDYENSHISSQDIYDRHPEIEVSFALVSFLFDGHAVDPAASEEYESLVNKIGVNGFAELVTVDKKIPVTVANDDYENKTIFPLASSRRRHFDMWGIKPKNIEQRFASYALMDSTIEAITLVGPSGTGKTLLAMAAALEQTLEPNSPYERIIISRPTVGMGGEDMGYLPGSAREKMGPWLQPIYDSFKRLMNGKKGSEEDFDMLEEKGIIEIQPLQFIRGRSLDRCFVIIDEAQNLTPMQAKTILTRAGKGTKIVLTGDPQQIDAPYLDEMSCAIGHVVERFRGKDRFASVTLTQTERSQLAEMAAMLL